MFLRAFAHITPVKLALTVALGLTPLLAPPRVVCKDGPACSWCLSLNFQQFSPLIRTRCAEVGPAIRVLERLSRPVTRILDLGYAYLAACLILLPWEIRRRRPPLQTAAAGWRAWIAPVTAFVCLVLAYAVQQAWLSFGAPVLLAGFRFQLDAAVLCGDIVYTAVVVWLLTLVFATERAAPGKLSGFRKALAVALVIVQATGILYRYSGLVAAPNDSFALLLGAAYVVAPINLLLALVTVYHTREAR